MSNTSHDNLFLVLCQGANGSRIAVPLDSFLVFNAHIDQDLNQLVERWSDYETADSRRLAKGPIDRHR